MSSIYKKGRDGYFYYQAYVYNPKTKKKNKRVFFSLGTKDLKVAKKKQIELDKKLKKESSNWFIFKKKYRFVVGFVFLFGLLFIFKPFNINNKSPNQFDIVSLEKEPDNVLDKKFKNLDESKVDVPATFSVDDKTLSNDKIESLVRIEGEGGLPDEMILELSYEIIRVDSMLNNFVQAKVYALIDKNIDSKKILSFAEKIVNDYDEFSNLIICFYAKSKIGYRLAIGNDLDLSNKEFKENWLAMYSYNAVEGAYFDDNPSAYLGGY